MGPRGIRSPAGVDHLVHGSRVSLVHPAPEPHRGPRLLARAAAARWDPGAGVGPRGHRGRLLRPARLRDPQRPLASPMLRDEGDAPELGYRFARFGWIAAR